MIDDEKLAIDESRRIAQHEAVKGQVRNEVHSEIVQNANQFDPVEKTEVETLAGGLKQKAITEISDTEAEIERGKKIARVSQVVDYIFYVIYGIIGLEIALELLGARDNNGFKRLLDTIAAPFLAPFKGLMPDPSLGPFKFMFSYIIALIVYGLIHVAVNGLMRIFVHKKKAI